MWNFLKDALLSIVAGIVLAPSCLGQDKILSKWPAGTSPKEIGKRVAERFVGGSHANSGRPDAPQYITYPEAVAWYGALTFAQLSGDKDLSARLIQRFEPLFGAESNLVPVPDHVDRTVFGIVPLEIYVQTKDAKYLDLGKSMADKQWEKPTPEGLTDQTRFWIDDMFMITAVQLQAYRATGDAKYLDRAALEMISYLDKLQQANGLFYHAPDVPFFWGRGDGWVAAGMAEMLRSLPENHPRRAQRVARARYLLGSKRRFARSLRRHRKAEQLAILPGSCAHHRRPAWPGSDAVVRIGAAALARSRIEEPWPPCAANRVRRKSKIVKNTWLYVFAG